MRIMLLIDLYTKTLFSKNTQIKVGILKLSILPFIGRNPLLLKLLKFNIMLLIDRNFQLDFRICIRLFILSP